MAALTSFPIAEAVPLPFPRILLLLQLTQCGSLMLRLMTPPEHTSHPTPAPLILQTNATTPQFSPDSDRVHPSTTNSHSLWLLLSSKLRGSKKNARPATMRGGWAPEAIQPTIRMRVPPPSRSFRSHQTKPPHAVISKMHNAGWIPEAI